MSSVLALTVAFGGLVVGSAAAAEPRDPGDRPPLIGEPRNGAAAVTGLGDRLGDVAAANDLGRSQLRELLLSDPSVWVDGTDRLLYKDPVPSGSPAASEPDVANYPYRDTFRLHSKPGSQRTIFLDFDGHVVSDTRWNDRFDLAPGFHPAFSLDAHPEDFNNAERATIQSIFDRVAEDYAPFDVDVTTEDPGDDALNRTSFDDETYGSRALISPSTQASEKLCDNPCGGVAYLRVFNAISRGYAQPAWVFPHQLGQDTKNIAETVSHEIGHNLGLLHDGNASQPYDVGHDNWAPIMGVGYHRPVVQWSKGDYAGADNQQDDLAVISSYGLPPRADESGDTVPLAAPELPTGSAYISTRTDKDVYLLGQCSGDLTIVAAAAPRSPNLDVELTLLDAAGRVLAVDDYPSGGFNRDDAYGMSAQVVQWVPEGIYYAQVDGVGKGDPISGFDDYGSLGGYTLSRDGACAEVIRHPEAPTAVTFSAPVDALSATITKSPPSHDGGSPITGYRVSIDGWLTDLGPGARSHTFPGLAAGTTYALTVAARNALSDGPKVRGEATTKDYPGAPTSVAASPQDTAGVVIAWQPPDSDGGSPVTGYQVSIDGGPYLPGGNAAARSYSFDGLTGRTHSVAVRAVNGIGAGTAVTRDTESYDLPGAVQDLSAGVRPADGAADVTWSPPLDDGGRPIEEYLVFVDGNLVDSVSTPGVGITGLERGSTYAVGVRARNSVGQGPLTRVAVVLPPAKPGSPRTKSAKAGWPGGRSTAKARWAPPTSTGGAAITGYKVFAYKLNGQGKTVRVYRTGRLPATTRARKMTLPRGRYQFNVRAQNSEGWGKKNARSNIVRAR